jgi:hypothetical protein
MGLKQLVMTGDRKSNGFVHLSPEAELFIRRAEAEESILPSEVAGR